MILIGITGNAGSGKTTAARVFEKHGFYVIDADKVVHKLLESQEVKDFIKREFGVEYAEDRKKLSRLLFENPPLMDIYENFIRQRVIKALEEEIRKASSDRIVIDAALIHEYGLEYMFDKLITIVADREKMIERLMKRGYSREHAEKILERQIPQEEKARRSDIVIENNGTIDELERKVEEVIEKILS